MDFLGMGPMEMALIALVALLVLGPNKVVEMSRNLGKIMRDVRKVAAEVPKALSEIEEPITKAFKADEEPQKPKAEVKSSLGKTKSADKTESEKDIWRS